MRDKKKLLIAMLCALIAVMAVGYAAFATQLNISGTASIDSTWNIRITNITERDIVGDASSKEPPSYTATTASFNVGLIQPGDSITYDIEVSNLGKMKAKVDSINVSMDKNDAIIYNTEGLAKGDTLDENEKDTLSITVSYNPEVTSQPNVTAREITVTINYVQDLGNEGNVTPEVQSYSIGDVVSFAGSNWYVIKDSAEEEDYVTLLKETTLTGAELGDYAVTKSVVCTAENVIDGIYGCTTVDEEVTAVTNQMHFYLSDTCCPEGYNGTDAMEDAGCSESNGYSGSAVREYLEGTYVNTLGSDNLKEVDGYKIRLISEDDLINHLGWSRFMGSLLEGASSPSWLKLNTSYFSMYAPSSGKASVGLIIKTGDLSIAVLPILSEVRPVINLLKSSI